MKLTFTKVILLQILAKLCSDKGLNLSSITSLLLVNHNSKISIHYGGQAEAYLKPCRKSTIMVFSENS